MGLGYGFMIQLIEWEWQHVSGGDAWGPEHLNRQIKVLSEEVADLKATLKEHGIKLPDSPV
jgi:hypothetical protein